MALKNLVLSLAVLLSLLSACIHNGAKPVRQAKVSLPYVDSILKYDTAANVRIDDWTRPDSSEGSMIVTNVNKLRIAVIAFDKGISYCYKKQDKDWILCDSFTSDVYPHRICLQ